MLCTDLRKKLLGSKPISERGITIFGAVEKGFKNFAHLGYLTEEIERTTTLEIPLTKKIPFTQNLGYLENSESLGVTLKILAISHSCERTQQRPKDTPKNCFLGSQTFSVFASNFVRTVSKTRPVREKNTQRTYFPETGVIQKSEDISDLLAKDLGEVPPTVTKN